MRYVLGFALLLLPVTAFAQMFEGPTAPIPVAKCEQTTSGLSCFRVVDGAGLTASGNYIRVDRPIVAAPR